MSELEHALRSALSDPPVQNPVGTDALWDIEQRLVRRRQRRRRAGMGALAAAAVAAVVVPISVYGPPATSNGASRSISADAGGGNQAPAAAAAVPATVRAAADEAAHAPGAKAARQVQWVQTTASRFDRLNHTSGTGQPDIAVYVIQLRGHFTCHACRYPNPDRPPTGIAQTVVVPVHPGQKYNTGFGPSTRPYDLSRLGTVQTFNLP